MTCPQCEEGCEKDVIFMHSLLNYEGKGFVHVAHGKELRAQFTPEEVRQHALSLLEAAEAAESDAMVYHMMRDRVGLDMEKAVRFIGEMRQVREAK